MLELAEAGNTFHKGAGACAVSFNQGQTDAYNTDDEQVVTSRWKKGNTATNQAEITMLNNIICNDQDDGANPALAKEILLNQKYLIKANETGADCFASNKSFIENQDNVDLSFNDTLKACMNESDGEAVFCQMRNLHFPNTLDLRQDNYMID